MRSVIYKGKLTIYLLIIYLIMCLNRYLCTHTHTHTHTTTSAYKHTFYLRSGGIPVVRMLNGKDEGVRGCGELQRVRFSGTNRRPHQHQLWTLQTGEENAQPYLTWTFKTVWGGGDAPEGLKMCSFQTSNLSRVHLTDNTPVCGVVNGDGGVLRAECR